jgi:lipopolysaccharide transport protein LptA
VSAEGASASRRRAQRGFALLAALALCAAPAPLSAGEPAEPAPKAASAAATGPAPAKPADAKPGAAPQAAGAKPAPQAGPTAAPAPPKPAASGPLVAEVAPFGLGNLRKNEPISIQADELEATAAEGKRHLEFRGGVRVVQADLTLESQRLEAFYLGGESQPQRLQASGDVHVRQGGSEAHCDEATYEVKTERIICRGAARVVDAKRNSMAGDTIEFDLARERVIVKGGAHLVFHPEPDAPPAAPAERS